MNSGYTHRLWASQLRIEVCIPVYLIRVIFNDAESLIADQVNHASRLAVG